MENDSEQISLEWLYNGGLTHYCHLARIHGNTNFPAVYSIFLWILVSDDSVHVFSGRNAFTLLIVSV